MNTIAIPATKVKHYVNNEHFLQEMIVFRAEVKEVEAFRKIDKVTDQERNPVKQNKGGPMRGTNGRKPHRFNPYPSPKRHENIIKRSVRNIIPYVLSPQGNTNEYAIDFSELFWSFSF